MAYFYLITAPAKQQARTVLKSLSSKVGFFSSSYLLNKKIHIILFSSYLLEISSTKDYIHQCHENQVPETALELLINWGISELKQDLNYIKYENAAKPSQNGCYLNFSDHQIIRSYLPLTELMLIINNTPDSFSEKGQLYQNIELILTRIVDALNQGVSLIDIGAESTRPNAQILSPQEEMQRLGNLIEAIYDLRSDFDFKLSLDSYKEKTIANFIDKVDIINDVSGNLNHNLMQKIADKGKTYIAMHSLSVPANKVLNIPHEQNPVGFILNWSYNKLEELVKIGFPPDQIILDLGIGFNKTQAQSWYLLKNIHKLNSLSVPILIGHSRKSFLNKITSRDFAERDLESAIISDYLSRHVVDYLRVHDINYYERCVKITNQLYTNYL